MAEQIRYVRESSCREEILATKIWRRKQGLYFPSFCLELAVIEALEAGHGPASRFLGVLEWLAEELLDAALRDPANQSNVVSELMSESEKGRVAEAARISLRAASWKEVV